jgi:hypothetical protein
LNVEKIAVEMIREGMDMRAIPLRDEWARRQLKIAVRDSRQLSGTGRLMLDHLQAAEGREKGGAGCGSSHAARLKHCRSHAENTALANQHWTSRPRLRQIGTRLAFFCHEAVRQAVRQAAQVMPAAANRGTGAIKRLCLIFLHCSKMIK